MLGRNLTLGVAVRADNYMIPKWGEKASFFEKKKWAKLPKEVLAE